MAINYIHWSIPYFGTHPYRKMKDLPLFFPVIWSEMEPVIWNLTKLFCPVYLGQLVCFVCRSNTYCSWPLSFDPVWKCDPVHVSTGDWPTIVVDSASDWIWWMFLVSTCFNYFWHELTVPSPPGIFEIDPLARPCPHGSTGWICWRPEEACGALVETGSWHSQATNGLQQRSCPEGDTRTAIGIAQPITQFWLDSNVCFFLSLYGKMMQTMFRSLKPPFRRGMRGNASILTHSSR